jgi:hypothetical protein
VFGGLILASGAQPPAPRTRGRSFAPPASGLVVAHVASDLVLRTYAPQTERLGEVVFVAIIQDYAHRAAQTSAQRVLVLCEEHFFPAHHVVASGPGWRFDSVVATTRTAPSASRIRDKAGSKPSLQRLGAALEGGH